MMEQPSRRSFLGLSSVALASAAFAGLNANAQEKASTQKAEHDHSSSDPGRENKALLEENPNSNTPPPTDLGDVVPIWYSFDLVKKARRGRWMDPRGDAARPAFFQGHCWRQHAPHCRQLSRNALAHR
jgi:oxalate decarboxylase